MKTYTVGEISKRISGRLVGNPSLKITKVEQVDYAEPNQITFIGQKKYFKIWQRSEASAAIVHDNFKLEPDKGKALIFVPNVEMAVAKVLEMFEYPGPKRLKGIHSGAIVDETASIGENVSIGPGCYIGQHVKIAENCTLYANVTILDHSEVGEETTIWPGVVIRERCQIGCHCVIHPNVTIGADGFGFLLSPEDKKIIKASHIDAVAIGNEVEIGAGTCIDRGKHTLTKIGEGTKIDNLVQIGHNCKVGKLCLISGLTGISGSVVIGDQVMIGGGVGIRDHVTIGSGAKIAARSGVGADIEPGSVVSGIPAHEHKNNVREWAAIRRLPNLLKKLRKIEEDT
jgi:UDP-3-O-[3-hydroxymyristoyl] glucosamine N-acyltransferase